MIKWLVFLTQGLDQRSLPFEINYLLEHINVVIVLWTDEFFNSISSGIFPSQFPDQDADNPGEKQPAQVTDITTEMIKSRSPSSVGETSPSFSNCSSPISPPTTDNNVEQSQPEPQSPKTTNNVDNIKQEITLPKLRLNVMLASDPALQPDAKDLKVIRLNESHVDNKTNHINNDRDLDDGRQSKDLHQHSQMVENKVENYMAPMSEPIVNVDLMPRVPGKTSLCSIV